MQQKHQQQKKQKKQKKQHNDMLLHSLFGKMKRV